MNERNKGLFPLILGLAVLAACGSFFGIVMWLSQPSIPSGVRAAGEAQSGPMTGALATVKSIPQGRYDYGGSATMGPIRAAIEPLIQAEAAKFKINFLKPLAGGPTSTRAIEMLIAGEVAFADSSRPLRPAEYKTAERLGFELQQVPVAIDGVAIVVHPDLDIEGLTIAQIRDIFSGNITNWTQVGGPDLAIRPLSLAPETSGTASFFVRRVLKGDRLDYAVEIKSETTPALRQVADTPGSIYYTSVPLSVQQCSVKTIPVATKAGRPFVAPYVEPRVPASACPQQRNQINQDALRNGSYPLVRRLFVITEKGEGEAAIAGKGYSDILLSAEGQTLIEAAGFVPTR